MVDSSLASKPFGLKSVTTEFGTATRLLVTWLQPSTRVRIPVGVLAFDGLLYTFEYLPSVAEIEEFRPLLGFRDFTVTYESDELFPLFLERVLKTSRPDFLHVLKDLKIDPDSATPWEQLVCSGGSSEGDTLSVTLLS